MEKKQTDTKVKPEAIVATIDSHNVLLDRLIKISILIAVLGGLCAVSPFTSLQTEFVKTGLILLGSVSAFVFFVVRTIKQNQITLPNNLFSYVLPILPIAYLIAAVFGEAPFVSLIGSGFEIGTVSFILAICLVAVLVSIEYRSKKALAWMQVGLFGFSGLVLLSLLVSFFFPQLFVLEGNRFFISASRAGKKK